MKVVAPQKASTQTFGMRDAQLTLQGPLVRPRTRILSAMTPTLLETKLLSLLSIQAQQYLESWNMTVLEPLNPQVNLNFVGFLI